MGQGIAEWWQHQSDHTVNGPYSAIGIIRDNNIIGALLFVNYTGSSAEMHAHLKRGIISKRLIKYVSNYIFHELGCNVLRACPYSTNDKVCEILVRLGFVCEAQLEKLYS